MGERELYRRPIVFMPIVGVCVFFNSFFINMI